MKKKILGGVFLTSVLTVAMSVTVSAAYTGYYSFEIDTRVIGTNKHSLSNSAVSTTVTGQSYILGSNGYQVSSSKDEFSVRIEKNWNTYYTVGNIKADGSSYTKNFGVISAGDYHVEVTKTTGNSLKIIGDGSLKQS